MKLITRLLLTTAMMALPSVAHAQLQLSPFAGVTMGGDTTKTSGTAGISASYWVFNWMGIEAEAAYSPMFFEQDGFLTSRSLTTLTGSFLFKAPSIGSDRFQPYLAAGLGVLRPNLSEAGGFAVAKGDTTALSLGVGATGFVNEHVGFRGDLRYFRGLKESDLDDSPFGLDFSKFSYWRPTVGLVVRF